MNCKIPNFFTEIFILWIAELEIILENNELSLY